MSSGTVGQRHHGGTDSDSHRPDSRFPGSRRPLRTSRYAVSPRVWVSSTTVGARHFHHHEAPSSCWSIATPPLAPPTRRPPQSVAPCHLSSYAKILFLHKCYVDRIRECKLWGFAFSPSRQGMPSPLQVGVGVGGPAVCLQLSKLTS